MTVSSLKYIFKIGDILKNVKAGWDEQGAVPRGTSVLCDVTVSLGSPHFGDTGTHPVCIAKQRKKLWNLNSNTTL